MDPSLADRLHLGATLYHSDVIVNVASTIAIEAAVMDTPIVNLATTEQISATISSRHGASTITLTSVRS